MANDWRKRLFGYGYLFAALMLGLILLALFLVTSRQVPEIGSLSDLPYEPIHESPNSTTRLRHYLDGRDWEIALKRHGVSVRGMPVPLSFNLIEGLKTYSGSVTLKKRFSTPEGWSDKSIALHFLGSNYRTEVRLNGHLVGLHEGGYTPFAFDVADLLKPSSRGQLNELEVIVDNTRTHDTIPGVREGWVTYGGILREVYLEAFDKTFISRPIAIGAHNGTVSVIARPANLTGETKAMILSYFIKDPAGEVVYESGEKRFSLNKRTSQLFQEQVAIKSPLVWSPETPHLYTLELNLSSEEGELKDNIAIEFGFRTIKVQGYELLLNGKPIKLKGVSRHEDLPGFAKTQPLAAMEKDIALLKELGVNAVRLSHYPAHPKFLELCDRAGLMVLEEIPVWGLHAQDLAREKVQKTALIMLEEMILRDISHPSVISWGMANEIATDRDEGKRFIALLTTRARQLDPSRPLYMASFKLENDLAHPLLDFVSFNCYYGWYMKSIDDFGELLEKWHRLVPNKPIIITEYGAGAVKGYDGRWGATFSEDYQAKLLASYWKDIAAREYVAGGFIWAFSDFSDNDRFMNPKPFFNLKGLVTFDRERKKSFEVMKKVFKTGKLPAEVIEKPRGVLFTMLSNIGTAFILLIASIATIRLSASKYRTANFRRIITSAFVGALFMHWIVFMFARTVPFGTTMVDRHAGEIIHTLIVSNWRLVFFFFLNLWLTSILAAMMYVLFKVLRRKNVSFGGSFPELNGMLNFILPAGLLLNLPAFIVMVTAAFVFLPEMASFMKIGLASILIAQFLQVALISLDYSRRFKIFFPIMLGILFVVVCLPEILFGIWVAANSEIGQVLGNLKP